jgi:hypothetical protein
LTLNLTLTLTLKLNQTNPRGDHHEQQ